MTPRVVLDRFIARATRPSIFAYWLDALLIAGLAASAFGVYRARTSERNAAVVVGEVRKGDVVKTEHIVWAPLIVSPRNVTRAQNLTGLVALRDLEPAAPLRWRDVARPRPRAKASEVELALKVFCGKTPPRADDQIRLGIIASEKDAPPLVVAARVLTLDTATDPADLTVAVTEADALLVIAVPKPQITLMQRLPQEK